MKSANCPGCGAALKLFSTLTKLVTCQYCQSVVIVRDDQLSVKGKQSGLTPTISGLKIGLVGELEEKRFVVLGRVRYKYSAGYWDEWYLRFNDGQEVWLSEDEGEMCLEMPSRPSVSGKSLKDLDLGDFVSFGKWRASIDEKDKAECIGFEGELPEEFSLGDKISYMEGSGDGDRMFTLEEDDKGVHGYLGRWVTLSSFKENPWAN